MQTIKFCRQLNHYGDLRNCLLVGGQAMEGQFERLASNPDIIIATPGRLAHHLVECDLALTRVEVVVFDEADRLFELGFSEQISKIMSSCPHSRQCLLFSATLPSQVMQFSKLGMKDPQFLKLDNETTLSEKLELEFLYVRKEEKIAAAIFLVRKHLARFKGKKGCIFFVATRHHVEFFATLFKRCGIEGVYQVYGSMDQVNRNEQVAGFKRRRGILVTTDVAARGIDIPLLDSVINYDFPPSSKLFVHRAGRTARAGEKGLCSSLVGKDDIPYTVELLLFLGKEVRIATLTEEEDGVLGGMPCLRSESEELEKQLKATDAQNDLPSLQRSMLAAYGLYYKTRPSASKQSVTRGHHLLEEIGGTQKLQSLTHPNYGTVRKEEEILDSLKLFRPSQCLKQKVRIISNETEEKMKLKVEEIKTFEQGRVEIRKELLSGKIALLQEEEQDRKRRRVAPVVQKRKMSKAERKKLKKGKEEEEEDDFEGFQISVDKETIAGKTPEKSGKEGTEVKDTTVSIFSSNSGLTQKFHSNQFCLSVDRSIQDTVREEAMNLDSFKLDLMGDDSKGLQQQRTVRRWDAKQKKYTMSVVGPDGRPVRKLNRRNEAGKKVSGDAEKSDMYTKWQKHKKMRIQSVGELENTVLTGNLFGANGRKVGSNAIESNAVEFNEECEEVVKKPIVPFHGEIDAKYLTNKQKRMMKKREGDGKPVLGKGNVSGVTKTVLEMKKDREKELKRKLKNDPKYRKQKAAEGKKAFWEKKAKQIEAKQARPRSFKITVNGKKETKKKFAKAKKPKQVFV